MLRCPKCGTDNLLSAVFCRGCGERMNLDEIRPDDFADLGTKKDSTTMQNIVGGIIIGVLAVGFVVGFCFPSCGALSTSEAGQSAAKSKYVGAPVVELTDQEATDLCCYMVGRFDGGSDGPKVSKISTRYHEDGTMSIHVRATFWGFVPASVTFANCNVGSSIVNFYGDSVRVGLLPVPEGLRESLTDPVRSACSRILSDLNDSVKDNGVNVSEGKISVKHKRVNLD